MLRAEIEVTTLPEGEASENSVSRPEPLTNALTVIHSTENLPGPLAELAMARDFARNEKAAATRHAYRSDFDAFVAWCSSRQVAAMPAAPETVAGFLAAEAARGIKPASIGRRVAAIRYAHKLSGISEPPTNSEVVKATVRGIRRTLGAAQAKKAPATADRVVAMATTSRADLKGIRDRALILLGFAGAFRRSELVALDVEDLESCEAGVRVRIRRSKTDQEGAGATIAIVAGSVACPVKAVQAWLEASGIASGPVFRPVGKGGRIGKARLSDRAVANVVKDGAGRVGLDAAQFSGHSLRSGFLTSAARRGASIFKMMDVSRHKSMDTLRGYVRDADLFRDHAGAGLL
ncbi:MAG TPA: site-specific integrase [Xanthobacteraceae bacterium]|jgi:site-specific recombinase XerD